MQARGTFTVKLLPAVSPQPAREAGVALHSLDKVFSGDLDGESRGAMLSASTEATGAMAYVALERVAGMLDGRSGSFLLMHNASMRRTEPASGVMHVMIVPHSGTEALAGISGQMTIQIEGSEHRYELDYQFA